MVTVHVRLIKQMIQSVCVKNLENKKVVNVIVDYMLNSSGVIYIRCKWEIVL